MEETDLGSYAVEEIWRTCESGFVRNQRLGNQALKLAR